MTDECCWEPPLFLPSYHLWNGGSTLSMLRRMWSWLSWPSSWIGRRCKLRISGCPYLSAMCSAFKVEASLRKKLAIVPTSSSRAWRKCFPRGWGQREGKKQTIKKIVSNISPEELNTFATVLRESQAKCALKNHGGYGERQLGKYLRYWRLNCKPAGLQEKTQN